jgi:hypothetical protein
VDVNLFSIVAATPTLPLESSGGEPSAINIESSQNGKRGFPLLQRQRNSNLIIYIMNLDIKLHKLQILQSKINLHLRNPFKGCHKVAGYLTDCRGFPIKPRMTAELRNGDTVVAATLQSKS